LAIKGKGRTRGRRVIAAPPRPPVYIRKPPIWRRPVVWIVVGVLALGGILTGVFLSLHHKHARDFKTRESAAIDQYTGRLTAKFPVDAELVPPDLIAFYPNFSQGAQNLGSGKLKPADAITYAKHVQTTASAAANQISGLSVTKLIPADFTVTGQANGQTTGSGQSADLIEAPGATRLVLQDAQLLMSQGLQLWAQAGKVLEQAARAAPTDRKALADEAVQLTQQGGNIFDAGYQKLLEIRSALGLSSQIPFTPQTSAPASPSPSPSSSPSPSPSH
jgi:hypothetical protein